MKRFLLGSMLVFLVVLLPFQTPIMIQVQAPPILDLLVSLYDVAVPSPRVSSIKYPLEPVTLGSTVVITVYGKNLGASATEGDLQIAFPSLADAGQVSATSDITVVKASRGDSIWANYGQNKIPAQYVLIDAYRIPWDGGEQHYLSVSVTPQVAGTFQFLVKLNMRYGDNQWVHDPPDGTGILDQQNEWSYRYSIQVNAPTTVKAQITSFTSASGSYYAGQSVTSSLEFKNTGNVDWTFWVGYTVTGPGGYLADIPAVSKRVAVNAFSGTVSLTWIVPSTAPAGWYTVIMAVWKDSPAPGVERFDTRTQSNAFQVVSISIGASITAYSVASGNYRAGESVSASLTFTNTGTVAWTFYVGYSVQDPSGRWWDAPYKTATVNPESSSGSISLSWTVDGSAPSGWYNARVAVWKGISGGLLQDRLDSRDISNAFQLVTPPSPPSLVSPSNGAVLTSTSVTFTWSSVSGATDYQIEVIGPTNKLETVYSTSYTVTLTEGSYTWRVRAHNSAGWSSWSPTWSLTIQTPTPTPQYGDLRGRVTDASTGNPIGGASVSVSGPVSQSQTTGFDGDFAFTLPVGTYTVTASASGYQSQTKSGTVPAGSTLWLNFELQPTQQPKQAPTAYIDSISPNPAEQGQTVSFSGHGSDPDGYITEYEWRSSIDGYLSSSQSFSTSSLSVGTHTIYFKVKDNDGLWSEEATATLEIKSPRPGSLQVEIVSPPSPADGSTVTSLPITFKVRVTSEGQPVLGARVIFSYGNGGTGSWGISGSDENGYAMMTGFGTLTAGSTVRWWATADKEGYEDGRSPTLSFTYHPSTTGDLEIFNLDSPVTQPEMGKLVKLHVGLENRGQAIVQAGTEYTATFRLVDYKGSEGSVWRVIDSYQAWKDGSWTMYEHKMIFYLEKDVKPGDVTWIEFDVRIPSLIDVPVIMTDTLEVSIFNHDRSDTGFSSIPFRVWPSWEDQINTLITLVGMYIPTVFKYKTVGEIVERGNPKYMETIIVALLTVVQDICDKDWEKTCKDILDLVLKVCGFLKLDLFSPIINMAKSLLTAGITVGYAFLIVADFIAYAAQKLGIIISAIFLGSPVDILIVTKDGRRIGYLNGEKYEEVEYSVVEVIEDKKYIVFPREDATIQLFAKGSGEFTLNIFTTDEEQKPLIMNYENETVNELTRVEVQLEEDLAEPSMRKDSDGDGNYDEEITPVLSSVKDNELVTVRRAPWWDQYLPYVISITVAGIVILSTITYTRKRKRGGPKILDVSSGPRIIEVTSAPRILEIKDEE